MNFKFLKCAGGVLLVAAVGAAAHEDLDLGIAEVTLNTQCRAVVTVRNDGHELPGDFYRFINPGFVTISKGDQSETLRSLRALDKKQDLKLLGGRITFTGKTVYAHNREPLIATLSWAEEFGDYGAGNNRRVEPIDCIPGIGQVAGGPIVPTNPDVAISNAHISPQSCLLTIEMTNLTDIPVDEQAWARERGISIMRLNLDTQQRAEDIWLADLDPEKTFTRTRNRIHWQGAVPFKQVNNIRVALWRVKGDGDFSNNAVELAVPEGCGQE